MKRKSLSPQVLLAGLTAVGGITAVFSTVLPVNASTTGFLFLIAVLGVATISGFVEAAIVSAAAMLCYNFFFLPPVGHFTIADPQNWVALFTFLLTALVASHLSERAKNQALEASRRQKETEQLYALSRAILLTDASRPIGPQAAQSIAQIFELPTVMLLDGKTNASFRGGETDVEGLEPRLEQVVLQGSHYQDSAMRLDIWPIALGGRPIGALAAVGMRASDGAVQSILNLVAIALERVRTEEAANRAEVARQSEEFKSTLLDAIAHEFKTPLTSIKAAATALLVDGERLGPDQQELAAVIEEETDRMSQLVTEAVKMAEIDAGKVTLIRVPVTAGALLRATEASLAGRGAERLEMPQGEDPLAAVCVDGEMIVLALRQLIDNALKYSPPSTFVRCRVEVEEERVVIRIIDQGAGIPERDRERIFEKFYRRASVRDKVPGSGLGLHIAREIARIHGGDLWVGTSQGAGAEFCFALPRQREGAV